MGCLKGCCTFGCFRPKWRRLVDEVYPADAEDGIMRNNMTKLTFYALSAPEKLDRIGQYLSKRLSSDIAANRLGYVRVAMDAMDQLLAACHAQMLNLFVESFLKMVQNLLECCDADLQCTATASFIKFSQIEEDTASYHRRYDFFVSKFSSMCHSNSETSRNNIRIAGIQGIQGVIRKTVSDDLQVNIWNHMDKIVPSLLYNIADKSERTDGAPVLAALASNTGGEESPPELAEKVFRDLVREACYGNLKPTLGPVLKHIDNHSLWEETAFAERVFKMIIYSVQGQYGHIVVQTLMAHLDFHSESPAHLKASITDVLGETVKIAAGGSIGPSVLDIFNSLLRHLRTSIESEAVSAAYPEQTTDNTRFQESIINAIGEFSNHLPDYQKIEIMMFVLSKVPLSTPLSYETNEELQTRLATTVLRTIHKVATRYRTNIMANAFPSQFTERLLQMTLARGDHTIRLLALQTIQALLDRHENSDKLSKMTVTEDIIEMGIHTEKPSHQDLYFLRKNGHLFMWHLVETFRMTGNTLANLEAVYKVMALMVIEMGSEESLAQFMNVALLIQDNARNDQMAPAVEYQCHAVLAAFLHVSCEVLTVPELSGYITQVIEARKCTAPLLLPEGAMTEDTSGEQDAKPSDDCFFSKDKISGVLSNMGVSVTMLGRAFSRPSMSLLNEGSQLDEVDGPALGLDRGGIESAASRESDLGSTGFESDSIENSPVAIRKKRDDGEQITFASLKMMLDTHLTEDIEQKRKKKLDILHEFQTAPFERLVAKAESRQQLQERLKELIAPTDMEDSNLNAEMMPMIPLDDIEFPDTILL